MLYENEVTGVTKKFQFKAGETIPEICQEVNSENEVENWKRVNPEAGQKLKLTGFAVLRKDPQTDVTYWDTYNHLGEAHVKLSPVQPLVFPTRKLALGTRVELFQPEE